MTCRHCSLTIAQAEAEATVAHKAGVACNVHFHYQRASSRKSKPLAVRWRREIVRVCAPFPEQSKQPMLNKNCEHLRDR